MPQNLQIAGDIYKYKNIGNFIESAVGYPYNAPVYIKNVSFIL